MTAGDTERVKVSEGKLIEQARQANRALVMNGHSSGAKLPESDCEDIEFSWQSYSKLYS